MPGHGTTGETPNVHNVSLELALAPDDVARLMKLPGLLRAGRTTPTTILWHDTPDGVLAARSLSLSEQRGVWRVEALRPEPGRPWPPGSPAPVVAQGKHLTDLHHALPDDLAPVAALRGRRLDFTVRPDAALEAPDQPSPGHREPDTMRITVLDGMLRGITAEQATSRVVLTGDAARLQVVALELASSMRLSVPRAGLAASAIAVARGGEAAARHLGPPAIQPGGSLSDSIAMLIGQLLDTMLHWAAGAAAGATPVPVHQMRVAIRRLRSALAICKHVAACTELESLRTAAQDTATQLGAARDWDVFLGGTGARVDAAFPGDRRVRALLAVARRRRQGAYADLRTHLASPAFRLLEVGLACAAVLRPWERVAVPDVRLQQETALFAAQALDHSARRVRRGGRGLADLPVEALHELRKDCKRLRYTAEFFQPMFPDKPARRYVKRLAALQEELGMLNDGAAAAGLLAHLGRAERSYAAGVVGGFIAAGTVASRTRIATGWKDFRRATPFWTPHASK